MKNNNYKKILDNIKIGDEVFYVTYIGYNQKYVKVNIDPDDENFDLYDTKSWLQKVYTHEVEVAKKIYTGYVDITVVGLTDHPYDGSSRYHYFAYVVTPEEPIKFSPSDGEEDIFLTEEEALLHKINLLNYLRSRD